MIYSSQFYRLCSDNHGLLRGTNPVPPQRGETGNTWLSYSANEGRCHRGPRERIRKALLEKGLWRMCLWRIDVSSISKDMGKGIPGQETVIEQGQWEAMKSVCLGNGEYLLAFRRCEQWCGSWSLQCMLVVLLLYVRCYGQGGVRPDSGLVLLPSGGGGPARAGIVIRNPRKWQVTWDSSRQWAPWSSWRKNMRRACTREHSTQFWKNLRKMLYFGSKRVYPDPQIPSAS